MYIYRDLGLLKHYTQPRICYMLKQIVCECLRVVLFIRTKSC